MNIGKRKAARKNLIDELRKGQEVQASNVD
jgi:hypothetical protein